MCICDLVSCTSCSIKGYLVSKPENYRIKSIVITKVKIKDDTDIIQVVWYNQPYMKNNFKKQVEYIFTGKVTERYGKLQMESPEYEVYGKDMLLSNAAIVPIYPSVNKLSQKVVRRIIREALDCISQNIEDFIPEFIRKKFDLCTRSFAVFNIHFPKSNENFISARHRLVFEEIFIMQLMLLKLKNLKKSSSPIKIKNIDISGIISNLPFALTGAQLKVINEILNDINTGFVINRLIQGDVGSGKTAVAIIISCLIAQNDMQCAIMVPTEILAKQHYESFINIIGERYKIVLLTGSLKKREKEKAYLNIKNGDVKIVIGTHALIQENVVFNNLALIITDEQHRFGVKQRERLAGKGKMPHILLMSATPIPRTLAIILYGDMDISVIDQLPPGRQKIETYYVTSKYRSRIYSFIKKQIDNGRQAYVICSMVQESDAIELEAVMEYADKLKKFLIGDKIEYLHGKMKPSDKKNIMRKFNNGEIDIIVSTTVIEVGINVVNANIIVIENAERFGLSQLHQLRGRVGRGKDKSYCILITDSNSKVCKQRMQAMVNTCDGFELSELDLKLRGPGDFFGTNQHGLPDFKIANIYKDMNIVKKGREAAKFMIENCDLESEQFDKLNSQITKFIGQYNEIIL